MESKVEELVKFIQEHYLWQFHSRAWDRKENINGILGDTYDLLIGKKLKRETPMEKTFYSESMIFFEEIKKNFSWLLDMSDEDKKKIINGVIDRMTEITITKSLNAELNNPNY